MKVLVLGAGGFLGSRVVAALKANPPLEVIAGTRVGSSRPGPAGVPSRAVEATERVSVSNALEGVSFVVNCVMASPETMRKGVDTLVEVALQRNIRRLVQISSTAVYGNAVGLLDETSSPGSGLDAYAKSKAEAEDLMLRAMERGLDGVILRPGLIYGPGSEAWTLRIGKLLRQRRLGDLGIAGDGFCNLIHVEDVAQAVAAALAYPEAQRQTFNLADPDPPRWNDYLKDFARAMGVVPVPRISARQLRLETKLLAIPLKIAEKLAPRIGLGRVPLPPAITPSLAAVMQHELRFKPDKTDTVLRLTRTPWQLGVAAASKTMQF